ncbi:MAG: hypothetical protein FWG17_03085 [Desulfovibrionaceae bacterium]|nr:hypothetical protein [Desulfovibrionaceae bacterium]
MPKPITIRESYKASRALALNLDAAGLPLSLDEASRSVEVIASTEAPAMVMDWDRWEVVPEVLLMSGVRIPASGQVPLLDAHSRESFSNVLGSFRGVHVSATELGPALVGRCHFSTVKEADEAFILVREGHATDVSVGYEVKAHIWLKEGESTVVEGKSFTGPLRIVTDWSLAELSLCPIGADANAKIRSTKNAPSAPLAGRRKKEKKAMPATQPKKEKRAGLLARLRSILVALGLRAQDDETEDGRQDVFLTDAEGNPIVPADLTEEELVSVVEELDSVLAEAEAELDAQGGEGEDDLQRAASKKPGSRGLVLPSGRKISPSQAALAERARIAGIRNLAQAHNLAPEIEEKLIGSGVGLTAAKAQVLDMTQQRNAANAGPGFHVSQGETEREKFRGALQDTLLLRCGLPILKHAPDSREFRAEAPGKRELREAVPGAQELLAMPMSMLAREALLRSGQRVPDDIRGIVGRALTTTDLPVLLVETSRRALMEAFEMAPETWPDWAGTGIATDFKKSTAVGLEGEVKPRLIPEYGEYTEGRLAENAEEYKINTFGRKMVISRQAIINDDLNALTALPRMYGEQTAVMVGDVAYAALLDTPNLMGDGKPLFNSVHRNLFAGKGGAPTVENLGAVVTAMKLQKDSFGNVITVQPKIYLAPVALEVASEQFFNTQLQGAGPILGNQANPLTNNPYGGNYFRRVYDRRMDAASPSAWILAAQRGTVVVYFLGGVQSPYIEEQTNFDTDGFESKVRMDVGAKAMRWVTLAKATA